jgi:long-subunit fatty acid transport protein
VAAINPVLSLRITPRVARAVGGSLLRGDVDYALALPKEVGGHGALGGHAYTANANLALSITLIPDRLRLGLSYRSPITLDFRGRADFSPDENSLDTTFADQAVSGRLRLPDVIGAGLGLQVTPRLRLSMQLDLARWSVFDKLEIVFAQPTTPNQTIERQSQDAFTARAGGEFLFPATGLAARAGLFFDQRSVRGGAVAPSAPDSHRVGATTGIGLVRGRFTADLGYLFLYLLPARSSGGAGPAGTYRATAHVLALTVGYRVP